MRKSAVIMAVALALVACSPKQVSAPATQVAAPAVTVQPADSPAPAAVEPAAVEPAQSANISGVKSDKAQNSVTPRRVVRCPYPNGGAILSDECAAYATAYANAERANTLLGERRYRTAP